MIYDKKSNLRGYNYIFCYKYINLPLMERGKNV